MAYALILVILLVVLIAVQLAIQHWARLVAREQRQERRTFASWREAPHDHDPAEGNDAD